MGNMIALMIENDGDAVNNMCVDYLRSIGIAIPFTTVEDVKPVTYSVEQQIENGWIKINPPINQ